MEPKITERFTSEKLGGLGFVYVPRCLARPAWLFWDSVGFKLSNFNIITSLAHYFLSWVLVWANTKKSNSLRRRVFKEPPVGLFLSSSIPTDNCCCLDNCCVVFPNLHLGKYILSLSRFSLKISKYPHSPEKFCKVYGSGFHTRNRNMLLLHKKTTPSYSKDMAGFGVSFEWTQVQCPRRISGIWLSIFTSHPANCQPSKHLRGIILLT